MNERKADGAALARVYHSAAKFLYGEVLRIYIPLLNAALLGGDVVLARLTHLAIYRAEHAVDELAARLATEHLGKFNSLVDSNFGGDLFCIAKEELKESETQDIAVYYGNLVNRPVWSKFFNNSIQLLAMLYHTSSKRFCKTGILQPGSKFGNIYFNRSGESAVTIRYRGGFAHEIPLKE